MKKVRLFFSFAGMFMAFGVLVFSVMAATSVSYNFNGLLNYTVQNAYVTTNTKVFSYGDYSNVNVGLLSVADLRTMANNFNGQAAANVESIATTNHMTKKNATDFTYDTTTDTGVGITPNGSGTLVNDSNIAIDLNDTTQKAYFIVITIKNLGSNIIHTELTSSVYTVSGNTETQTTLDAANVIMYQTPDFYRIEQNQNVNIVIGVAIKEVYLSAENILFKFNLSISHGEVEVPIQYDNESSKYYVEMGYIDSNKTIPIVWEVRAAEDTITGNAIDLTNTSVRDLMNAKCTFVQATSTVKNKFHASSNEYATSDIRTYLNGDFVTNYYIDESDIYTKLNGNGRTLTSLYSNIASDGTAIALPGGVSGDTKDNFWLLSKQEAENLFASNADRVYNEGYSWWFLRSPHASNSSNALIVSYDGSFSSENVNVSLESSVRAAFQLVLA